MRPLLLIKGDGPSGTGRVSIAPETFDWRVVRFGLVGISGIVVNSIVLALLVQVGQLRPPLAGALATEVAIVSNFVLHDRWTFRDARASRRWSSRALRYNLSALGGLSITVATLTALTNGLHLYYLIANVFAVGAGCLCNYLLSSRFAWAVAKADPAGG
ncbi:MAG: GtrA family protein [Chloroflexota bacterium]